MARSLDISSEGTLMRKLCFPLFFPSFLKQKKYDTVVKKEKKKYTRKEKGAELAIRANRGEGGQNGSSQREQTQTQPAEPWALSQSSSLSL